MVSLNWGRNKKGEAFVFFSIIIIVKKIRDPKHGKQRHVAQVLSKITMISQWKKLALYKIFMI